MDFAWIEDQKSERTVNKGDWNRNSKPPWCIVNMKGELLLDSGRTVGEDG